MGKSISIWTLGFIVWWCSMSCKINTPRGNSAVLSSILEGESSVKVCFMALGLPHTQVYSAHAGAGLQALSGGKYQVVLLSSFALAAKNNQAAVLACSSVVLTPCKLSSEECICLFHGTARLTYFPAELEILDIGERVDKVMHLKLIAEFDRIFDPEPIVGEHNFDFDQISARIMHSLRLIEGLEHIFMFNSFVFWPYLSLIHRL